MNNDLISRSALMELAHNHVGRTVDCNDIARFPAVDAEVVVRCRDCKHYTYGFCELIEYIMDGYYANTFEVRNPDDFCSRGVRELDAEVKV